MTRILNAEIQTKYIKGFIHNYPIYDYKGTAFSYSKTSIQNNFYLGNTSLPGNDSLGASLIKPDKWSFLANKPTFQKNTIHCVYWIPDSCQNSSCEQIKKIATQNKSSEISEIDWSHDQILCSMMGFLKTFKFLFYYSFTFEKL